MLHYSKHKMGIKYGKCTYEHCLCTCRCERSFKTHNCLRHSDTNLQKHQLFAYDVHNRRVFTHFENNKQIEALHQLSKIETIIQDYDNKPLRIRVRMQTRKYNDIIDSIPTLLQLYIVVILLLMIL